MLAKSKEKKPFPNYLKNLGYFYDKKVKQLRGYQLPRNVKANDVIKEMRNVKPSELTSKDIKGFIRFYHDKYSDEQYRSATPGKWLLRFPSGSKKIDKAWGLLVDSVAKGELDEIKVFPSTDEGEFAGQQTICVYNINVNDKKAVVSVYDRLVKLGLVGLHLEEEMNGGVIQYKSDQQTARNEYGQEAYLHTNQDINILKKQVEIEDAANKLQTYLEELFVSGILKEDKTAKGRKQDIMEYLKDKDYEQLLQEFKFPDDSKTKKTLNHLIILKEIADCSLYASDIVKPQDKIDKFAKAFEEKEKVIKDAPDFKSAKYWKILKGIISGLTVGLAAIGFAAHAYKTTGSANFLFKGKHERLRETLADKANKAKIFKK